MSTFNPKTATTEQLRREILFVEDQMYQCRCMDIKEFFKKLLKEYRKEYESRKEVKQ